MHICIFLVNDYVGFETRLLAQQCTMDLYEYFFKERKISMYILYDSNAKSFSSCSPQQ